MPERAALGELVLRISRRAFVSSALACSAVVVWPAAADAPRRSPFPAPRPVRLHPLSSATVDDIIAAARLGGMTSLAVCDVDTGEFLEVKNPVRRLPPASVVKSLTALYALDMLGADYRFVTRLVATGPIEDGLIKGDLVLVGSGDPTLDTDALGDMARALAQNGVRRIGGRLLLAPGALPFVPAIEPGQPPQAGYNPAISGLNLNFNRVYFEWQRQAEGYRVTLDARAERFRPEVRIARMQVVDRELPVYTYADQGGSDQWTVARPALGNGGGRWLPVRKPARYVGEVFRSLAAAQGVSLPEPEITDHAPPGETLFAWQSGELRGILRGMLHWSTNLTAEVVGLTASRARGRSPVSLADSAASMEAWARERLVLRRPRFIDHSGLGDGARLCASDLVTALRHPLARAQLAPLLRRMSMRDSNGLPMPDSPIEVHAKTGTLNFVSALAGYVATPSGRRLAFAIISADLERRAALRPEERERPEGGRAWTLRARRMQNELLARWGSIFAA